MSASRPAASSTRSPRRSGWTPLSDRLKSTWFSYVDCMRSMANGSSLIVLDYTGVFLVTHPDPTGVRDRRTRSTMTSATPPNLARIPAGDFLMGAADAEEDERPVHHVFVSEFFIGRFPVTQDEYARFVRATGHPAPNVRSAPLVASGGRDVLFHEMSGPYISDGAPPTGLGSHPVLLVRHDDALAY